MLVKPIAIDRMGSRVEKPDFMCSILDIFRSRFRAE
jgi:hypothetical protein